jgi:hypothetical protein
VIAVKEAQQQIDTLKIDRTYSVGAKNGMADLRMAWECTLLKICLWSWPTARKLINILEV